MIRFCKLTVHYTFVRLWEKPYDVVLKMKNRLLDPHWIWMLKTACVQNQEITPLTGCFIVYSDPSFRILVGSLKKDLVSKWITILESSGVLSALWLAPSHPVPVLWFDSSPFPLGIKLYYYQPRVQSHCRISILSAVHNYSAMVERNSIWKRH